ncbi:MAG: DUF433 domain-containing protein, partial [Firmicutes bacterium]|nr:DUF433 domain-containing protein [Bacillota bacterium]
CYPDRRHPTGYCRINGRAPGVCLRRPKTAAPGGGGRAGSIRCQPGRARREVTPQEILTDYSDVEPDDVKACLAYARALVANESIEPVNIEVARTRRSTTLGTRFLCQILCHKQP